MMGEGRRDREIYANEDGIMRQEGKRVWNIKLIE